MMESVNTSLEHFVDIPNPLLFLKVRSKIEKIVGENDSSVLTEFPTDLVIPDDTMDHLKNFLSYKNNLTNSFMEEKIHADIYRKLKNKKVTMWKELEFFLKIEQMKNWSDEQMKQLMGQINNKNVENLREMVKSFFGNSVQDVDDFLEKNGYYDINSLMAEIVDHIPVVSEDIITYWDEDESFFLKKTIYIKDSSFPIFSGKIEKCLKTKAKDNKNSINFELNDKSVIDIYPENIFITKNVEECFWSVILKNKIEAETFFQLKHYGYSKLLPRGQYQLTKSLYTDNNTLDEENSNSHSNWHVKKNRGSSSQPSKNDSNTHTLKFEIRSCSNNLDYLFEIEFDKIEKKELSVKIMNISNDGAKEECIPSKPFCEDFKIEHSPKKKIAHIDSKNMKDSVIIKDEWNEAEEKRLAYQDIEKKRNQILDSLTKSSSSQLLSSLLESLIKNKLAHFGQELEKNESVDLKEKLLYLSQDYEKKLNIKKSSDEILSSIVRQINYTSLINKQQSYSVATTMSLLDKSEKSIQGIENEETVLFIGNTGSGKSTTISYLLCSKLHYFLNPVGDHVIKLESGQDESKFPKIGQALGESETLYSAIYKTKKEGLSFIDCPGFNDTRGSDYEICANMSIDEAVERTKSLKAVVVIIPVQAFLSDRSNNVIELVKTVQERFPFAFHSESGQNSKIFVLITKNLQSTLDAVNSLKDGNRYKYLMNEALQKLDEQNSANIDTVAIKFRFSVWSAFCKMHENSQIDFVDTKNKCTIDRLLKKYTEKVGGIDKKSYVKAMLGKDMKRKFGKDIEMATDTWRNDIIIKYNETMPQMIAKETQSLSDKKEKLIEINQEFELIQGKIAEHESTLTKIKKNLEGEDTSNHMNLDIFTINSNSQNIFKANELEKNAETIKNLDKEIKACKSDLASTQSKMELAFQIVLDCEVHKSIFNEEIQELAYGVKHEVLHENDLRSFRDEKLRLRSWKSDTLREDTFKSGRKSTNDDFDSFKCVGLYNNYTGPIHYEVYINRDYYIVPRDRVIYDNFQKSKMWGKFEASVTGEHYEIDLGVISDGTGKNVRYGYNLQLKKGRSLPWIQIVHKIPNAEYNETTIININAKINRLTEHIAKYNLDLYGSDPLVGLKNESEGFREKLDGLINTQKLLKEANDELKKDLNLERLNFIKDNTSKIIDELKSRNQKLPSLKSKAEKEIKEMEKILVGLKLKKKHMALIIHDNWSVGELIAKFCERLIKTRDCIEDRSEIMISCRKFLSTYNENKQLLAKNCAEELDFSQPQ
mmetsp:Transcript_4996/g.7534  ORF Transcript_4996/g.7534 Transcript_4996/m.7534 type:complete len:1276 (-) Transcript_4996:82-3909(-)